MIRVLKREIIFYVIFYFNQTYILFTFFSCRLFWFLYFDNNLNFVDSFILSL